MVNQLGKENLKKFLIVTLSLSEKNGLGRYSKDLIGQLAKFYNLEVFSGRESGVAQDLANVQIWPILPGLPFSLKMRHPVFLLKALWGIWRVMRKREVLLIHSFMDFPHSFLAALLSKIFNKPLFLTAHGTYSIKPFGRWPDQWINSWVLKQAKRVICVSRFTESELKKRVKLTNTLVINNGINFEKFQKNATMKEDFGRPRLISVGALKHRKGYHVLIPSLALIKNQYPNFLHYIIGDQSDTQYFNLLKSQVKEFFLEANIKFLEEISDEKLTDYYYQADVFVLTPVNTPDAFEGFGLVYLEAGACGLPVIGTTNCGAEDAILDGRTGFLVRQGDGDGTANAILKLLKDQQLAAQMGGIGRERARKMDWQETVKEYLKVYAN